MNKCEICDKEGFHKLSCTNNKARQKRLLIDIMQADEKDGLYNKAIPTLKGESAEEFNRKADENYEKFKARQKQALIDMMEADEKLGLYEKPQPTEDIEALAYEYAGELLISGHLDGSITSLEARAVFERAIREGYQLAKKVLRDRTSYRTSSKGFLDN